MLLHTNLQSIHLKNYICTVRKLTSFLFKIPDFKDKSIKCQ